MVSWGKLAVGDDEMPVAWGWPEARAREGVGTFVAGPTAVAFGVSPGEGVTVGQIVASKAGDDSGDHVGDVVAPLSLGPDATVATSRVEAWAAGASRVVDAAAFRACWTSGSVTTLTRPSRSPWPWPMRLDAESTICRFP